MLLWKAWVAQLELLAMALVLKERKRRGSRELTKWGKNLPMRALKLVWKVSVWLQVGLLQAMLIIFLLVMTGTVSLQREHLNLVRVLLSLNLPMRKIYSKRKQIETASHSALPAILPKRLQDFSCLARQNQHLMFFLTRRNISCLLLVLS